MATKKNKSKSKKIPVAMELPSDSVSMASFVEKNRKIINEMLVSFFDYAVRKNFGGIEVFYFRDSSYVVVVNRKDFRENLQNIFDYSLENEFYETCAKAKNVMELMDKYSFVVSYSKTKSK